jgi:1-aminocyclopropane-1-carboxylate deaminase/D-cysteine desulfhydrase-like pyridoxal-dependent ACC family enzyme
MAIDSIFPVLSIDRNKIKWEDHMYDLTSIELRDGIYWKREDYFAPLGYGGINGSKLRQLLHLISQVKAPGIITGASVLSPQLSMGALVAKHYGLPIVCVLGGTKPETAIKHENVAIAAEAGADFYFGKVAYNPGIQSNVSKMMELPEYKDYYRLNYGITVSDQASDEEVKAFHEVGAYQVQNIPDEVTHLAMTAGSCNSCVSVLYGLAKYKTNVKKVTLFGIGPTRLKMIEERLEKIERATGLVIRDKYKRQYVHHRDLQEEHQTNGQILLKHYDLHYSKFSGYSDKMPYKRSGIDFHFTYEGKALTYLDKNPGEFEWYHNPDETTLFWIVGSEPRREAMKWTLST